MSDGSTSTTGFNWSVEGGGAVSVSGLYTAPSTSQETPATITATKGGKSGTATVLSVFEPATIEAKANISGKVGGSTTAFTTMFTATNSSAEDYSFVVSPTSAGTVSAAGVLTLSNDATGTVTVKATHKTQSGVEATITFTGVVAKAAITGKTVTGKVGGDTVTFAELFTATNSSAEDYSFVVSPTSAGTVSAAGVLTLSNDATGTVTVKATHKTQSGVEATITFTGVVAKAAITGKTVTGKVGGDTVTFAELFTATNSSAEDYNFVSSPPEMTSSIDESTGLVTLAAGATGDVTITATHKTQTSVTATATITVVSE